jgi:protein required for attachment to host cells
MLLPHGTVIALVDGEKLDLFRNGGNESHPELAPLPAPTLDETRHNAGQRQDSNRGNPSGHHHLEASHAAAVAEWLNSQVLGHKIEHLVVIADPRTLGEMRRHYHKQLEAVLLGELAKDLAGRSGPDIIAALREKA